MLWASPPKRGHPRPARDRRHLTTYCGCRGVKPVRISNHGRLLFGSITVPLRRDSFKVTQMTTPRNKPGIEIPLGDPQPRGEATVVEKATINTLRQLPRSAKAKVFFLVGIFFIAAGLAKSVNDILYCWNFSFPGSEIGCAVGLSWVWGGFNGTLYGPELTGLGAFPSGLVFLGTTLVALGYGLSWKSKSSS